MRLVLAVSGPQLPNLFLGECGPCGRPFIVYRKLSFHLSLARFNPKIFSLVCRKTIRRQAVYGPDVSGEERYPQNFGRAFLPRCIVCNAVFLIAMPSARPSHACICDKMNESSADILIPYERKIHLLFRTQRIVEILGQTDPPHTASKRFKNGDFQSIFARSGSAVTPSEKKFNHD